MDEIRIDNLMVRAFHGVYDDEKEKGQRFYINAVLYTDTRTAGVTDELEASTDYGQVCSTIGKSMTRKNYNLIETAAEHVAEDILTGFPLIKAVDIEIRKPEAPVPMEFESISVKIHRAWHDVYIAFGSNMGDSEGYIDDAMQALQDHDKIVFLDESTRIKTKPYGGVEQDDFLNGVCHIKTLLTQHELLDYLHELEAHANRVRDIHWGPRTLDLDIIFYDDMVYEDDMLVIPHIDMENRDFVLIPMCELAPYLRHPVYKKTMRQMLRELERNSK